MERSSISLPREECMKCRVESDILMSSRVLSVRVGSCNHNFCQNCFRKESANLPCSLTYILKCPCCYTTLSESLQSIDEAILVCQASTIRIYITPHIFPFISTDIVPSADDITSINDINHLLIQKLEAALLLNQTSFTSIPYFVPVAMV